MLDINCIIRILFVPQNTSFYISDPSILGSKLFDSMTSIKSYKAFSDENNATGFVLNTDFGNIKLNIMHTDQIESHLNGFGGYIHSQMQNDNDLTYVMARLRYVSLVLGGVIDHKDGDEENVHKFLFEFNSAINGLMFLYDSVWDWSSDALCGPHKNS